jgi:hypothetical protein
VVLQVSPSKWSSEASFQYEGRSASTVNNTLGVRSLSRGRIWTIGLSTVVLDDSVPSRGPPSRYPEATGGTASAATIATAAELAAARIPGGLLRVADEDPWRAVRAQASAYRTARSAPRNATTSTCWPLGVPTPAAKTNSTTHGWVASGGPSPRQSALTTPPAHAAQSSIPKSPGLGVTGV